MADKENAGEFLYPEESYAIRGAVFDVYREMGCGFAEAVYQECLEKEFAARGIPFEAQKVLNIKYKGIPLVQTYKADLICFGKIFIELKAAKELAPEHHAQLFNYLRATGFRLGLLVNFGHYPKVEIKRLVR